MKHVIWIMLLAFVGSSAPVETWFQTANAFYEEGQYDSAAAYYRRIIDAGVVHSTVLYNLGNCWYRLGEPGLAMLSYKKAALRDPTDPDIQNNIQFIARSVVDRIPEPERTTMESVLYAVHTLFDLSTQLWLIVALLFVLSAACSLYLFVSRNLRLWLLYLCVITTPLFAGAAISAGIKIYRRERVVRAVILADVVDAVNQPNGTTVIFTAHEGTRVRVRKTVGEWSLVSLPGGVGGWLESDRLGIIR